MAAVSPAPPADQTTDLMQRLSLDPKNKGNDASDVAKQPSGVQYGSANGGEVPIAPIPTYERSLTPLLQEHMDASMCYLPNGYTSSFYYGGYNGLMTEWEDYPRYANPDGAEVPPPGVYGDVYHHGYGYASYGPYPSPGSPIPTLGQNGQLYGSQNYHFPATYYQPPTPTSAPYTTAQTSGSIGEVSTSAAADIPPSPADTAKAISDGTTKASSNSNNGSAKTKPFSPCCSFDKGALPGGHPPAGFQDPRFGVDGMWSPVPFSDGSIFPDGQKRPPLSTASPTISHTGSTTSTINQNLRPLPHLMGIHGSRPATPGMVNKMYPNHRIYDHHANGYRSGQDFRSGMHDSRMNGRWGMSMDSKYKPRGRSSNFYGYGNENLDGMNELNKGPRSGHFREQKGLGPTITLAIRGQSLPANGNSHDTDGVPEKDQYNKADFPETYSDAKFFIIKSYSEDDIHKSIKYSIWASTPHGNKKLDAAYQESKQKTSGCPVFLFFSVNTSGQFVGVAEMVGPVNFNKTLDYWQQDKWVGGFPVKWHIVKDVPNSILKHITLENNDNKPVTNSRDTQEVKLDQGLQLLKLFKELVSKTSILDDFNFYETRQKMMQEKRTKHQQLKKKFIYTNFWPQVMDGKPVDSEEKDKEEAYRNAGLRKPSEVVTISKKESGQGGLPPVEHVLSEKNGLAAAVGVAPKDVKPATETQLAANGVVNNC
ncbi:YTH domain-containing protein ECT4 isoform X1 [Musa acuminata AAA Group]|uniref:YTH domain-containing protein ECT4 isoform X1 n=2 Tax=Musa acuminata AAA Group TaxID=214697 RepID=UPI0031DF512E